MEYFTSGTYLYRVFQKTLSCPINKFHFFQKRTSYYGTAQQDERERSHGTLGQEHVFLGHPIPLIVIV